MVLWIIRVIAGRPQIYLPPKENPNRFAVAGAGTPPSYVSKVLAGTVSKERYASGGSRVGGQRPARSGLGPARTGRSARRTCRRALERFTV